MSHWDALEPEAYERLANLDFRALCFALLDYAPSASAADLYTELRDTYPDTNKSEFKRMRTLWKAGRDLRATTSATDQAQADMLDALMRAASTSDAAQVIKCAEALASLRGVEVGSRSSGQDWSRLTPEEEDELIRLVHKLHGEEIGE